jgi:hypothetical protein
MRLNRCAWFSLLCLTLAVAAGIWFAARMSRVPGDTTAAHLPITVPSSGAPAAEQHHEAMKKAAMAQLLPYIGKTVREVEQGLNLGEAKRHWVDEPPGILRGANYRLADGREVWFYISEGEPLFRQFSDRLEWDYKVFVGCRVGGIQYLAGEVHLDIGPAVPGQWRW